MNSYHNHIVDELVENFCLSRSDLFIKLGLENRRAFRTMVDRLIAEKRIRYESDITGNAREVLSPKVLKLVEFENRCNAQTRSFIINYAPTDVLEKVLDYVKPGIDPFEDELDFHLEIMGYKLEEKYKAFFEAENGFTLDFTKFHYDLWSEYLFPKNMESAAAHKILYVDTDSGLAEKFMKKMKDQYVPDSTWYQFSKYNDAYFFLEKTLQNRTYINLIVFRCNSSAYLLDFILKFQELVKKFEAVYSGLIIPFMILEEPGCSIDFAAKEINQELRYLHYPADEDEYILGNVIKSLCNNS